MALPVCSTWLCCLQSLKLFVPRHDMTLPHPTVQRAPRGAQNKSGQVLAVKITWGVSVLEGVGGSRKVCFSDAIAAGAQQAGEWCSVSREFSSSFGSDTPLPPCWASGLWSNVTWGGKNVTCQPPAVIVSINNCTGEHGAGLTQVHKKSLKVRDKCDKRKIFLAGCVMHGVAR